MTEEGKREEAEGVAGEVVLNLTKQHILVLFLLDKYDNLLISDIKELLRRGTTYVEMILGDLKDWGLIREIVVGRRRRIRVFFLTEKGKKFVEFLKEFTKEAKQP